MNREQATGIQSMNLFKFNIGTQEREKERWKFLMASTETLLIDFVLRGAKAAKAPFPCSVAVVGGGGASHQH